MDTKLASANSGRCDVMAQELTVPLRHHSFTAQLKQNMVFMIFNETEVQSVCQRLQASANEEVKFMLSSVYIGRKVANYRV